MVSHLWYQYQVLTWYWFGDLPDVAGFVVSLMGGILTGVLKGKSRTGPIILILVATYFISASAYQWDDRLPRGAILLLPFLGYIIGIGLYPHGGRIYSHASTPHGLGIILILLFILVLPDLSREWNNPDDQYAYAIQNNWLFILLLGGGLIWYLRKKG